jgi:tRNA (cmo5U34)-methyltransferase
LSESKTDPRQRGPQQRGSQQKGSQQKGSQQKDQVYASPMPSVAAFEFDAGVADVFQDMIQRSVPGYGLLLDLIGVFAQRYGRKNSNCYDLGCSLGASTLQLKRNLPDSSHVIAVDTSEAMADRCRSNLLRDHSTTTSEVRLEDLRDTEISNASLVILNFTLQFVPDNERQGILNKLGAGINEGGALLLAEKVRFEDSDRQTLMTDLHHEFKRYHGYSDLEISQKRAALENVLVPNTEDELKLRLMAAGFREVELCVRCLNFEAFIAIK